MEDFISKQKQTGEKAINYFAWLMLSAFILKEPTTSFSKIWLMGGYLGYNGGCILLQQKQDKYRDFFKEIYKDEASKNTFYKKMKNMFNTTSLHKIKTEDGKSYQKSSTISVYLDFDKFIYCYKKGFNRKEKQIFRLCFMRYANLITNLNNTLQK